MLVYLTIYIISKGVTFSMKKSTKMLSFILAVIMVISLVPFAASAEKAESGSLSIYCVLSTGLPAKNAEVVLTNKLADNVIKTYTANSDGIVLIPKNLRGAYYVSASCDGPVEGLEWHGTDGVLWDMNKMSDTSCLRLFPVLAVEFENSRHNAYMVGYSDGTFGPEQTLTRGEVANLIYRLMTRESRDEYYSTENSFNDVQSGMAYNTAISTLRNAGVLDGFADGSFGYKEVITREQFAAMLGRLFDASYNGTDVFRDIADSPAKDYINLLGTLGILSADENGNFNPKAELNRGDVCAAFNRLLGRMPTADSIKHLNSIAPLRSFSDVNEDCELYADIMEATNGHVYMISADEQDGELVIQENWLNFISPTNWTKLQK